MATTASMDPTNSRERRGIPDTGLKGQSLGQSQGNEGLRYLARQPIMDRNGHVHGYELLFRAGPSEGFSGDGIAATRTMLDNLVIFGADRLTGGLPMFVNCTQESLLNDLVLVLQPEQTVLELLETLTPTVELLTSCRKLKARGFRLALDDFVWKSEWLPFVELADYVKVDLSTTSREERLRLVRNLRGFEARLVAERVENEQELAEAKAEGFTLFQGYYFCRPVLIENRAIPANHLIHLEMLHAVHDDPLDIGRISKLVKRDASLTYRLLRVVNSPLYGTRKEITSIQGALVMIGDEMFRRLATLTIASEIVGERPTELLRMAYLRGRFCELAAAAMGQDPTEQYLLGILSLLPAMLRVPMEQIAKSMPLRGAVRDALLGETNAERTTLEWILCYEGARWDACDKLAEEAGLKPRELTDTYTAALLWAEENMRLI